MYHSLTFKSATNGEKNTWKDWNLIPTSRPVINPPEIKENYLDIPGTDGLVDLSDTFGRIMYGNRKGSIEFAIQNDRFEWYVLYTDIMEYLHGSVLEATLEDDPGYYYKGRWNVNNWKSDSWYSLITLDYNLKPYKIENISTLERWLWDPFSFIDGIARDYTLYNNVTVSGSKNIRLVTNNRSVEPLTITLTSGTLTLTVTYTKSGATYGSPVELKTGKNVTSLYPLLGDYTLKFTGNGVIKSIEYIGGRL